MQIHKNAVKELTTISSELIKLADNVDALKEQRSGSLLKSKWYQAVEASIAAYHGLLKEYEEKQSHLSLTLYGEWVQQRNQLLQKLKQIDSTRKEVETIEKQVHEIYAKLIEYRKELFEKRSNFLKEIIGDDQYVRMELVPYGDVDSLEDEYRSILALENGKFVSSIYDQEQKTGIIADLLLWEEKNIPPDNLPELISKLKTTTWEIANGEETSFHGAFANKLKKILETQPSLFDHLSIWFPEDLLLVKYSKEPASGRFEDLEKGSAGQKAAAILAFLLSYGTEPLIIDQPEDDLDNALIYDLIVKQIHANKEKRQLLIATHNPNIVVNGDSELVNILKFAGGQTHLDQQGGLEEVGIRDSICTIMEGGRTAFDLRYKRITLER